MIQHQPFPHFALLIFVSFSDVHGVAVCPGYDGPNATCDSGLHRICAQILQSSSPGSAPVRWGREDFWMMTGQVAKAEENQWDDLMRSNDGDSWCVDLYLFETMAMAQGCENVHVRCDATDLAFIYDPTAAKNEYSKVQRLSNAGNTIRHHRRTGVSRSFSQKSFRVDQTRQCLRELCPLPKSSGKAVARSRAVGVSSYGKQTATRIPSHMFGSGSSMLRQGGALVGLSDWTSYRARIPGQMNLRTGNRHFATALIYSPHHVFSTPVAALIGLLAGYILAFAMFRLVAGVRTLREEPFLADL